MTELERLTSQWGDWWIWCAFEPRLKILIAFMVGKRDLDSARRLIEKVKKRSDGFIPFFTSDELPHYENALKMVYGTTEVPSCSGRGRPPMFPVILTDPSLDYAQVVKTRRKGKVVKVETKVVLGNPERIEERLKASPVSNKINTSFVERNNSTLRQDCRRLTRKTYGFSKRVDMLEGHINIISAIYHFCRYHYGLKEPLPFQTQRRKWYYRTPAMVAGITDHRWKIMELLRYPMISN